MRKLYYFLPCKVLFLIYFSLIHSHIQYLCSIWGNSCKSNLKPIQILQNRALKAIHGLPNDHSTFDLYSKSGVLPIKGIFNSQICTFVKGVLDNKTYSTIKLNEIQNNITTRSAGHLYYSTVRTNSGMMSINYSGPKLYNAVPNALKKLHYQDFKNSIKYWLLLEPQLRQLLNFKAVV